MSRRRPGKQSTALGSGTALTSTVLCSAVAGNSLCRTQGIYVPISVLVPTSSGVHFPSQDPSSSDPTSAKTSLRSPSSYTGNSLGFLGVLLYQHLNSASVWAGQWLGLAFCFLLPKEKSYAYLCPALEQPNQKVLLKIYCYRFGESASPGSLGVILFWLAVVKEFIFKTWHFYLCSNLSYRPIIWPLKYLF